DSKMQMGRFGGPALQVSVRLRRKARVSTPAVFVRFEIMHDDLADEVRARRRFGFILQSSHTVIPRTSSIARAMRFKDVSRPNTTSVSNSGGATLRPHTATRIGWNNCPVFSFNSCAPARRD